MVLWLERGWKQYVAHLRGGLVIYMVSALSIICVLEVSLVVLSSGGSMWVRVLSVVRFGELCVYAGGC